MKIREWYIKRGPVYLLRRARVLSDRYGFTASKAVDRLWSLIETLAEYGCSPTLPTPGCVVERHPEIIRRLQDCGAEIAVHGYEHLDLTTYPPEEAREQLERAVEAFARHGIQVHGFRCPYLACNDRVLDSLPSGMFEYSSNEKVWWDVNLPPGVEGRNSDRTRQSRYAAPQAVALASNRVCLPYVRPNLIEIPVSLPDDLDMHDNWQLNSQGMSDVWLEMLRRAHRRGDLFLVQFHPELVWGCEKAFRSILEEARQLQPAVWTSRLEDISAWWREKEGFSTQILKKAGHLHLTFDCSDRATILMRGLDVSAPRSAWHDRYYRLNTIELDVPAEPPPFVGVSREVPSDVVSFLRELGYILDRGETAAGCATYIDDHVLKGLENATELVDHIESSSGPLVRYWHWPDGARTALSFTGDLDALTLFDYASRFLVK